MGNKQSQKQLKEDIDFIKQHTSYDDATILEMFEGFKRDCPEGTMTPEQFGEMYKKFIVSSKTQQGNFKLENADKFSEELTLAIQKSKITTPNAAIAIPVTSAIIRVVTAPLMTDEELTLKHIS